MKGVRAFLRLPARTQAMALEAAFALLVARFLVQYVPMRLWRHHVDTAGDPAPAASRMPRKVGWIVPKVARRLPFHARCLPQAMAAQWMLRRRGVRSRLVFGARRGTAPETALEFHAWLIAGGECVIGGQELETFTVLAPPEAACQGPRETRS